MSKDKFLTVKEFAEKHKVGRSTVSLWCRNGTIKEAIQESTPFGDVWYIPEKTSNEFVRPTRGRPKGKSEKSEKG
jgi:predicted site-specific integrase-resolvase